MSVNLESRRRFMAAESRELGSTLELDHPPSSAARDEILGSNPVERRVDPRWLVHYARGLIALDFASATVAVLVAYVGRFGGLAAENSPIGAERWLSMAFPFAWVALMAVGRAYETRFLGIGSEEFRRTFNVAVRVTAAVALLSYALKLDIARGFVVIALPLTLILSMLVRGIARVMLHRRRKRGRCVHRAVLVGNEDVVAAMVDQLRRRPNVGFAVSAICLTSPATGNHFEHLGVPVMSVGDVLGAVRLTGADTVAVTSSTAIDSIALRSLAWDLQGSGVDLLVAPALTDVAGTRIHMRPVSGLPLLHVEEPQLSGGRRLAKTLIDRTVAGLALLFLALPLLAIASVVRLTSAGPALFRQERVGRDGHTFSIVKFRSMYVDADARLAELRAHNQHGPDGVLFKMKVDPRITSVGRWLRRLSIDELPQLINVAKGHMSLVGPRPPLPQEVALYAGDVHRRLLVKPGLTGLWQVSGRSDLSWDESVRLDLHYVENWSLALDVMILARTLKAVVSGSGAY